MYVFDKVAEEAGVRPLYEVTQAGTLGPYFVSLGSADLHIW